MASGGEVSSDEIINFKCTACAKRNWTKEAVKYCVECQGYCCQTCIDTHEFFPTLVTHTLLDRSSLKSSITTKDLPEIPTERCAKHETNLMNMYCGNHDIVACTTCMTLEHRICTDVKSIPDEIDKLFRQSEFENVCQNIREEKIRIEKTKEETLDILESLSKSKDEAVTAIKDFRKEVEFCLVKQEKESIREVEKKFCEAESILKNQIKKLGNKIESLKQLADDVKKADGNKAQKFVSLKAARKNLNETKLFSNTVNLQAEAKIVFVIDENLREYLKQQLTFGSVSPTTIRQTKTTAYTVKGIREIDIKAKHDTAQGDIHGSCLTEEGSLLLADYNNEKLKVVNIDKMSVVDQCNLPARPTDVGCIKPYEGVVSLNNNAIQFISVTNPISLTRLIHLNHSCYGIYCHSNKLYITDNSKSLYIHGMTGDLLQRISKDDSGNDLFVNSRKITLSDSGDKIFIADSTKGVLVLDTQGKHSETFNDSDVTDTSAICTDYGGNIFVYGKTSNNVVQVAQNGTKKLTVIVKKSDGVHNSLSITFDPRRCTLIISQCNNNKVKLFDLQ